MRKIYYLIALLFVCSSCASMQDIERKKAEGDSINATFNYSLDKVYDATKFVIRHSENSLVNMVYRGTVADYNKEEKTIVINIVAMGSIDMGIFFENTGDNKTKVYFVKGAFTGAAFRETRIKTIIEEVGYYLDHGEAEYRKYTHEKAANDSATSP